MEIKRTVLSAIAAQFIASLCLAGVIGETEPNDTIDAAQPLPPLGYFQVNQIAASITPGDVDYFSIEITVSPVLMMIAAVDFIPVTPNDPGPLFGVFGPSGELIDSAPFSQVGLIQISMFFSEPGVYTVGITGLTDGSFAGLHDQEFGYELLIYTASSPSPGAFPLILGAALLNRRRRTR
jgi:hypothetical protein